MPRKSLIDDTINDDYIDEEIVRIVTQELFTNVARGVYIIEL